MTDLGVYLDGGGVDKANDEGSHVLRGAHLQHAILCRPGHGAQAAQGVQMGHQWMLS